MSILCVSKYPMTKVIFADENGAGQSGTWRLAEIRCLLIGNDSQGRDPSIRNVYDSVLITP